jgi:hypothetical protein
MELGEEKEVAERGRAVTDTREGREGRRRTGRWKV